MSPRLLCASPTRFRITSVFLLNSHIRHNSQKPQYQAPNPTLSTPPPPAPADNPHVSSYYSPIIPLTITNLLFKRAFYKSFGIPFAKVFLGAMFTYQVLYYSWLKLESMEQKKDKDGEEK